MSTSLLCLDAVPQFLNSFDFSVAPPLLFYAYVPIVIFLLFLSIFVAKGSSFSLKGKLFLALGLSFAVWVLNILLQWVAVSASVVYFAWQVTALIEIFIPVSTIYLAYALLYEKDISFRLKAVFASVIGVVAILTPTQFNMSGFDIAACEGLVGPLTYAVYLFEILAVVWIIVLGFKRYKQLKISEGEEENEKRKKLLPLIVASSSLFLFVFSLSNIAGELTQVYSINLYGPIGMAIFLGTVAYMMVRFQAFDVKVFATQALVWILLLLIGAELFFIKVFINYVLTAITFFTTFVFGNLLVRSVKVEIKQKEKLAILLKERESLEHLISHKVKGSFTRSKFVFAEMLDGSFGEMTPKMTEMAQGGLDANNAGIKTVDLILNSFNLQSGSVKFDMQPLDFKALVQETYDEKKGPAEEKGLKIALQIDDGDFKVNGDVFWLKEVINNLLENSTRYTPSGSVDVFLKRGPNNTAIFSIKDTGVGITPEDKENLFKQGGRGKNSVKINTDSTGYGLYSVKLILDAHKGSVWAESAGQGKGSAFFVKLDLID